MNWTLILLVFLCGCTVTVTPLQTKTKHAPIHKQTNHKKVNGTNVKETWWIENYHKLEAAHGDYTIPSDSDIVPMGNGQFKVPSAVLTHYQDLLLAKPSPSASPTGTPTY